MLDGNRFRRCLRHQRQQLQRAVAVVGVVAGGWPSAGLERNSWRKLRCLIAATDCALDVRFVARGVAASFLFLVNNVTLFQPAQKSGAAQHAHMPLSQR